MALRRSCCVRNRPLWRERRIRRVPTPLSSRFDGDAHQRDLYDALERGEPWGVWGGELIDAGRVLARKRPRGRPRKHPVAA